MKNKRVLWICNHTTLMETECKILMNLGFEVFVPKQLPKGAGINARTAVIDSQYDNSLTIPSKDLEKLNNFNFYDDNPNKEIAKILNKYFGICLCVPLYPGVCNLAQCFKGLFGIRVFGHAGDMNYELATTYVDDTKIYNCFDRLVYNLQKKFKFFRPRDIKHFTKPMFLFHKIKNRLFFASAYDNIGANEPTFFQKRDVYLPLGLPDSIFQHKDSWEPKINKIMFVCPSLDNPYYKYIYDRFKENFSDLPYDVFGKQNEKYDDPHIIGYLSREDYDKYLTQYKCMFYHSKEQRHLHYHPLEAIAFGMPLIFMSGGLIEHIMHELGIKDQPGMAEDFKEAHEKIERILNDDIDFINNVRENQKLLLQAFSEEYIEKVWRDNFLTRIKNK